MMRQNPNFVAADLADTTYLLPFGQAIAAHRHGVSINGMGLAIWDQLAKPRTDEELIHLLAEQYQIAKEDMWTFTLEIRHFVAMMRGYGLIVEDDASANVPQAFLFNTSTADSQTCLLDKYTKAFRKSLCNVDTDQPHKFSAPFHENPAKTLNIAGIQVLLYGNLSLFSKELDLFTISEKSDADNLLSDATNADNLRSEASDADNTLLPSHLTQQIYVTDAPCPVSVVGTPLLTHLELCVQEFADGYRLQFPANHYVHTAILSRDGQQAVFYYKKEDSPQPHDNHASDMLTTIARTPDSISTGKDAEWTNRADIQYEVFHALRLCFLYLAGRHGMYAIHSASILYDGCVWLFTGPSGTGKSTHTNLWRQYYDTPILNGDLNLLAFENGWPVIHGIPWCGTSGICENATRPLAGITLLRKNPVNEVYPLSPDRQILGVLQRYITPLWDARMLERAIAFTRQLVPQITVAHLSCDISKEAVDVMRAYMDTQIMRTSPQ